MVSCRGKTALVTNASDAPGSAAATALANAGARVLIHDQNSIANVEAIVNPILSTGGVAKAITADLSTAEGPQQLARHARGIVGDRLDILVLNVGCSKVSAPPGNVGEPLVEPVAFAGSAPFLLVQRLLPILNPGSSVIFMYPASGATQSTAVAAVAAAAGSSPQETIVKEMRHLADAFRPRGIRVNGLEISRTRSSSRAAERARRAPGRALDPQAGRRFDPSRHIGAAITFLASSESREVTGTTMRAHMNANTGHDMPPDAAASESRQ